MSHDLILPTALVKIKNITLPLLRYLARRVYDQQPSAYDQAKKLLEVTGRHFTYITKLALEGINFYHLGVPEPIRYHRLTTLSLNREEAQELLIDVEGNVVYRLVVADNPPSGLHLILATMKHRDYGIEESVDVEMYEMIVARDGEWLVPVSDEIKIDKHLILKPLGLVYLNHPSPQRWVGLMKTSASVQIVNLLLVSLPEA